MGDPEIEILSRPAHPNQNWTQYLVDTSLHWTPRFSGHLISSRSNFVLWLGRAGYKCAPVNLPHIVTYVPARTLRTLQIAFCHRLSILECPLDGFWTPHTTNLVPQSISLFPLLYPYCFPGCQSFGNMPRDKNCSCACFNPQIVKGYKKGTILELK